MKKKKKLELKLREIKILSSDALRGVVGGQMVPTTGVVQTCGNETGKLGTCE